MGEEGRTPITLGDPGAPLQGDWAITTATTYHTGHGVLYVSRVETDITQ